MREILERIMREYPSAKREEFSGHGLADYIRSAAPQLLGAQTPTHSHIDWLGSAGRGQWADAPWIAGLDPLVTETPQAGYYPVYLFARSLDEVYLSLNQGMTSLRKEFGFPQTKAILAHRATILRTRLDPDFRERFSDAPIHLQPKGPDTRLAMYEPGHALGRRYHRRRLPSTDELTADLVAMLDLYRVVTERGGAAEFDVDEIVAPTAGEIGDGISLDDARRLRYHRTIERNPRLAAKAKRVHGYTCQACRFSFEEFYGELGHEYIEAHHLVPLAALFRGEPVRLSPAEDFAVVCANCHSMIHRAGAPESFQDFVLLLGRRAR